MKPAGRLFSVKGGHLTYALFLLIFLGLPLLLLVTAAWRDRQIGKRLPDWLNNFPALGPLLVHVFLAVTYTTPWDNYLVATGVWYYDPALVIGITLGWVPIEEYTFFVLQTLATGLWLLWLARRVTVPDRAEPLRGGLRWSASLVLAALWVVAVGILWSGWQPGVYLGLILVWALPPIILQTAFGADILWRYRRLVFLTLGSATLYLAITDSLAINSGTWTIDPAQSLNLFLGGILPVEEFLFFLVTNVLIVFGMTLALACDSRERLGTVALLFKRVLSFRRSSRNFEKGAH